MTLPDSGVTTSIVIVAYDMARELPRTLRTLAGDYQRDTEPYEVIVVDNGSPVPIDPGTVDAIPGGRLIRLDPAPASPARAVNTGISAAVGDLVGVMIDGARMVSPGLISAAQRASRTAPRPVITSPAYHLGREVQMTAAQAGYDQTAEDELLASVPWSDDGYRLFDISVLAASSARGWFRPMGESNALFMPKALWDLHGGYDEAFDRPGGGLVNHDAYRRACELDGVELITLLGEGTFHQFHGGASTGGKAHHDELWGEYESRRGRPFAPPQNTRTYYGTIPAPALTHLRASISSTGAVTPAPSEVTASQRDRADRARIAQLEAALHDARSRETWLSYLQRRASNIPASIRRRRRERATRIRIEAERVEVGEDEIERRRAIVEQFLARTEMPGPATDSAERSTGTSPVAALPTSETPLVSVIIPTHNAIDDLVACLESFHTHPPGCAYEIIVANDVSDEREFAPIRTVGGLRIVDNPENLGFLLNCNAAARDARGEFLWFLNSDTELTHDALDALVRTFDEFPDVAIAGSRLTFGDGSLQEAGGIVWRDGSAWNYGRGGRPDRAEVGYARRADYVSGAALMVRRAFFDACGGFDTAFSPAYYEDTDLCMQATAQGHQVIYQPASTVIHHEGGSHGTDASDPSSIKHHQIENQATFERKWRSRLAAHAPNGTAPEREKERHVTGRVLVVDARMLTPDRDAGSLRMRNLMRTIRDLGQKVTFVPQNLYCEEPMAGHLRELGVEVVGRPDIRNIDDFLRDRGGEFDTVILSRLEVARDLIGLARKRCPRATIVYDTVDLHFLRTRREVALGRIPDDGAALAQLEADELGAAGRADVTLVVSTAEKELLDALLPDRRIEVLGMVHEVDPTGPGAEARNDLVFVGSFEHPPNLDGIEWFIDSTLPQILAHHPDTVLHVVGSDPPASLAARRGANVAIHGFVQDLAPFYETARVAIAPLRYGAGVKGKVTEALSRGVPMVATTIAVEGTSFTDERDLLVADEPEAFAAAVCRLLDDDGLWNSLRSGGLSAVDDEFGVDSAREGVIRLLTARESTVPSA